MKVVFWLLILAFILLFINLPRVIRYDSFLCQEEINEDCIDIMEKHSFTGLRETSLIFAKNSIEQVLKNDTQIKSYDVSYIFPNKLYVMINKRAAIYAVTSQSSSSLALVDEDGVVLDLVDHADFPTLFLSTIPNPGEKLNVNELFSLKILTNVMKSEKVSDTKYLGDKLIIVGGDGVEYIFPSSGDIDLLVGTFNMLVSRLNNIRRETTIGNNSFLSVDFRYNNPIIRLQ